MGKIASRKQSRRGGNVGYQEKSRSLNQGSGGEAKKNGCDPQARSQKEKEGGGILNLKRCNKCAAEYATNQPLLEIDFKPYQRPFTKPARGYPRHFCSWQCVRDYAAELVPREEA